MRLYSYAFHSMLGFTKYKKPNLQVKNYKLNNKNKAVLRGLFLMTILSSGSFLKSQNLIEVDWINYLCEESFAMNIANDKNGNVYYLGQFSDSTDCTEEMIYKERGTHFLLKTNRKGDKIWVKQFGGSNSFNGGLIEVNLKGEVFISLTFQGQFYYDGIVYCHSEEPNPIILTVDTLSNLRHFKLFESSRQSYIRQLELDDKGNIYCNVSFSDTLKCENVSLIKLSKGAGSDYCLFKINIDNSLEWYHQFYASNLAFLEGLEFVKESDSSISRLIVAGSFSGDSLFINKEFYVPKDEYNVSPAVRQSFLVAFSEEGENLKLVLSDPNILVKKLTHFNDKIYTIGYFNDTVYWKSYMTVADRIASLYIAELNCNLEVDFFKHLSTFSRLVNITDFQIDEKYGFLITGSFDGEFITGLDSLFLDNEGDYSSMITNLNDNFEQVSISFLKGRDIFLRPIVINDDKIIAACNFDRNFRLENFDYNLNKRGSFLFQTSELLTLPGFDRSNYLHNENSSSLPYFQIYPNPFLDYFSISGTCEIGPIQIYNAVGKEVTNFFSKELGFNEVLLDAQGLPSGMYFIYFENYTSSIVKVVKVN